MVLQKNKVITENFTSVEGEPVFFASNLYLSKMFKLDGKTTNERLALFTYLGLVKKLAEKDIPEFLLKQAKHEAAKKKQKHIINFYSIPAFGETVFSYATMKAKEFKCRGFTMKGFSRELLFRTLGEAEADRVYPRLEGQPLSVVSEERSRMLEQITYSIIQQKGWTTEKEIISSFDCGCLKASVVETQLKRMLPEMIEKYGLRRTRLNKVIKEQLAIDVEGYPYIILLDG